MKITKLETILLAIPNRQDIADSSQDAAVIKVHTDEGIVGIGQADTNPQVVKGIMGAEFSHKDSWGMNDILIGENPLDIERLMRKIYVKANHYGRRGALLQVMSGIEVALWDILGKSVNLPIYRLLGGAFRNKVAAYASCLFPPAPDKVIENAGEFVEKGFRGIKFGWGVFGGQSFEKDMKMVESIRKGIGDREMMIDAGESMDTATAIRYAHALADYDVYWFEDPLHPDNLRGYERLVNAASIRIAAGEGETSVYPYLDLIERVHLDVVQADAGRVGGISVMMKIAQLAYLNGVQFVPHCWNTDIVLAATLHVLAAMPQDSWIEYAISESPLRNELCHPHFEIDSEGCISIPDAPGLGIELNEDVIKKYRIA